MLPGKYDEGLVLNLNIRYDHNYPKLQLSVLTKSIMANPILLNEVPSLALRGRNLKCFSDPQGFDEIKPMNVIIGKNNSGKSALLDLVQHAVIKDEMTGFMNRLPEIYCTIEFDEFVFKKYFDKATWQGSNELLADIFGKQMKGIEISWPIRNGQITEHQEKIVQVLISILNNPINKTTILNSPINKTIIDRFKFIIKSLTENLHNPFDKCRFSRILADRDISVETVGQPAEDLELLMPNGDNATRLITRYLKEVRLDRSVVEKTILNELNKIFHPEAQFNRIVSLQRQGGDWELYLEEPKKGLVPLSKAGSGIKTVLLVLMHLYLMPDVLKRSDNGSSNFDLSVFLFGFEELENNLHPSLLRKLFLYLRSVALLKGCKFFITTHSHVVIDLFSRDPQAQIIHTRHDGTCSSAKPITTFIEHRSVFQDLEVRASDLLQTNAIVWVEGPSDKTYFNKWVELWTNGELREHVDYEVVFTAGSLLAHYSFDEPTSEREQIEALKVNPNAIILIDSDKKKSDDDKLKARAERVIGEIERMHGISWITAGKEVENYIPDEVLDKIIKTPGKLKTKHSDVFAFIKSHKGGDFTRRKPELAARVCEHLTRDMIAKHMDMGEQLELVCNKISSWNNRGWLK